LWDFFKSSQDKKARGKIANTGIMLTDNLGDKYSLHYNNTSYKGLVSLTYKELLKKLRKS